MAIGTPYRSAIILHALKSGPETFENLTGAQILQQVKGLTAIFRTTVIDKNDIVTGIFCERGDRAAALA